MKNKDFKLIPNKTNTREYFLYFNTLILESTPLFVSWCFSLFFILLYLYAWKPFLKKISSDLFAKKNKNQSIISHTADDENDGLQGITMVW